MKMKKAVAAVGLVALTAAVGTRGGRPRSIPG